MSTPIYHWNFRDCRNILAPTFPCSIQIRDNHRQVHKFLSRQFVNEASDYTFYFHLAGESCDVRRPLSELFDAFTPDWWDGITVPIHWERSSGSQIDTTNALSQTPATLPVSAAESQFASDTKGKDSAVTASAVPRVITNTESGRSVLLHLSFVPFDAFALLLKNLAWHEETIEVPITISSGTTEKTVREAVVKNLETDIDLFEVLEELDCLMLYSVEVQKPVCGALSHTLKERGHSFATLQDFFEFPTASNHCLNLQVHLDLEERPYQDEDQPPNNICKLFGQLSSAKERVVEQRVLLPGHDQWDYVYVRLGNIRPKTTKSELESKTTNKPRHGANSKIDTSNMEQSDDAAFGEVTVVCEQALIGFYFAGYMNSSSNLYLSTVLAWDFGDYCIGNCLTHWEAQKFSRQYQYATKYAGVKNKSDLHKRVQNHLRQTAEEPLSGVPFMPTYSCNFYKPGEYGLGVEKEGVAAVIRYVNHVSEEILPWGPTWTFGHDETSDSIKRHLIEELREYKPNGQLRYVKF